MVVAVAVVVAVGSSLHFCGLCGSGHGLCGHEE